MGRPNTQARGGGKGKGRGPYPNKKNNNNSNAKSGKKEYKFQLHGSTRYNQQSATYDQVKEEIVALVQRTFTEGYDIAESIRKEEGQAIQKPTREMSQLADEDARKTEQEALDMAYKADLYEYAQRKRVFEANKPKTFSLIMTNYCSTGMKHKIEEESDYEESIRNDPFALLKRIKTLMHAPADAIYAMESIVMSLKRVFDTQQQEGESLADYNKRCKQARDVF